MPSAPPSLPTPAAPAGGHSPATRGAGRLLDFTSPAGIWTLGAVWTVLVVGAVLATHDGDLAMVELDHFVVFLGLWCAGVLLLVGMGLAVRGASAIHRQMASALGQSVAEQERLLQAIRDHAASYRALLSTSVDGVVETDEAGRLLESNAAFLAQTGYTADELRGRTIADFEAWEDATQVDAHLTTIRRLGNVRFESRLRARAGHLIDVEVSATYVPARGRFVAFVHDISTRQAALRALHESEAALNAAQRVAAVGSWKWHVATNQLEWSDEMFRIFGIDREKFTGRLQDVIAVAIHPEDRAAVEAANRRVAEEGRFAPIEYRVVRPDGSERIVWAEPGELIRSHDGRPVTMTGIVKDMTAQRATENQLRAVNARFAGLIASLEVGVLVEDTQRRISVANEALCRLFRLPESPRELEGSPGEALAAASQFADPAAYVARVAELVQARQPSFNEVLTLADGRVLERDYTPIAAAGAGEGHLWVFRDVSEHRRIEQALEKRLVALTKPVDVAEDVEFEELFNLADIQKLQDQFARAAGVASLITRPDGVPITRPSNFTHLCAGIIRGTEVGRCHCMKSDAVLGRRNLDGPTVQPCLSGGLWDAGASIVVGGRHIANWLIGQVRNEAQSEEQMRAYARTIGTDEEAFLAAFREVPSMSRERFQELAQTLFTLAQQLSSMAYQNVQQARFITERDRAEQALRASEERFREAIEHAGAGYFRIDRAGRYEAVNTAWLEMHGFQRPDEVIGKDFAITQLPEDLDQARQIVRRALAGEEIPAGEFSRRLVNGTTGYHTFSVHPVHRGPEIVAIEGFLIDTTPLRKVMADYKMLFDTMLDGLALHEIVRDEAGHPVDLRYLAVNPAFERQTGLQAADVIGRRMSDVIPGLEPIWMETYRRVAETGEAAIFENYSQSLQRHFKVSAFRPSLTQIVCVFVDITARKLAETEFRKLSRAVEQSPVSVIITNLTGAIEYVNPCFTETTGYTLEEVRGKNPRMLSSGELPHETYQTMWQTIASGHEWRGEFHNRKKDGSLFWAAVTVGAILDEEGKVTSYLAVEEDVTARKRAAEALAASERRFRSLVESVPNIAVQGYDRDRRVVFWNRASEGLYGYTHAEALGRRLEDLIIPAEMREPVIAAVDGFCGRGEPIPAGELVLRRKDGTPVSVYSSHVKLERIDGVPEMYCIDIDLTARKEAERALAESHDFHLRLLSEAPALIWRAGKDAQRDWFNTTWLAFTGRGMEDEIGDGWTANVHREDLDRYVEIYRAAFAARQPFQIEYRLRRRDGEYRWIAGEGIPFKALDGEFGGYIGYGFDITDRRRAEEQIREQAALLDVTQDGIVVTTMDRRVTFWNRGAEIIYGIPAAEARGQDFGELVYRERPKDYDASWAKLIECGEWSGDRQHCTRAGKTIDVQLRCTAILDAAGKPRSTLAVVTDVTEGKRMEQQFLRAQRIECLGALASGVAHDLNNVLTPILMAVELLRPLAREKHDHDMLQLLSDSARRGSDIVQQLLLFGRGSDSPRTPLNAGGVIKDMGRMMRETFPKNIVLSVQAPADLWLVDADRTQIHQVVLNLCVNARDAMPQGGRLIVAAENVQVDEAFSRSHAGKHSGPHVRITIKDTGVGISPADLEKIFDPFFTTKPVGQGTGLGLATVLGIVRSHEGIVDVTSIVGQGSTFEVYLPAGIEGAEPPAQESGPEVLRGHGELVLVVEDEENIRSLLQRALTSHNYRVLIASDGAEALGVYAQHAGEVNVVITDAMMPVMDGAQTVRALRRLKRNLPIIAISGMPAQRTELDKNPGPAIHYLPKPFATDHALRLVRQALDEAARASETAPPPSSK